MMAYTGSSALCSPETESSVLGGLLRRIESGNSGVIYAVHEDDFAIGSNRMIYNAMRSLCERKQPVDMLTLDAEMERLYPNATGEDTQRMVQAVSSGAIYLNLDAYIERLKAASMRRKLLALAEELAKSATDAAQDVGLVIDSARAKLRDMVETRGEWTSATDVMIATCEDLEKRQKGEIVGIQSGVQAIDRATGGFFPGELAVIGARPSVGKSAFGLQIAVDAASKGRKVCFASCEMVDTQFGQRLICAGTSIDGMKMRNANLNDEDWEQIVEAMGQYAGLPISFTFGTRTVEDLRNDVQKKVDMGECELLVVDYLQLLQTKRRFDAEHERVGYVSRMLKRMTTEFKIPIVALAQVKRQNNAGRARCPVLDELRSSGEIEQDADTVILMHRPDDASDNAIESRDKAYFDTLTEHGMQYIAFSVAKQRQGQTGIIGAVFDPAHMRYLSIERIREAAGR